MVLNMPTYTTGDVAKLCGVSVRTVQFYDKKGILAPTELSEGGRRIYSEEDLRKMHLICLLRELDLSLDKIAKLMAEKNSDAVISLILEEQEAVLRSELLEKQTKLKKLSEIRSQLKRQNEVSVDSIAHAADVIDNKRKARTLHITLLLLGIPLTLLQWVGVILWITTGIWWVFAAYAALIAPVSMIVSSFYFNRVDYICPDCHEKFSPNKKEAFWANHTPTTRKLTCPKCGHKSFCVETYRKTTKSSRNKEIL